MLSTKPHAKIASPIKPVSIYFANEDMVMAPEVSDHTVLIGAGPIGREILLRLQAQQQTVYVQENNLDVVTQLRAQQIPVAYGHALADGMLEAVFIPTAKNLIIAIYNQTETLAIIEAALTKNPHLEIIVFSNSEQQKQQLILAGATKIIDSQIVLAEKMVQQWSQ